MEILLKLKSWQLFMLVVGINIVIAILTAFFPGNTAIIFSSICAASISAIIYFMWMWEIVVKLNKTEKGEKLINDRLFKISYFIIMLYFFLGLLFRYLGLNESVFYYFMPFIFFLLFYCMLFVSKLLIKINIKRDPNLSDYVGWFFLFYFYPIGIWFIQPKVNKFYDKVGKK